MSYAEVCQEVGNWAPEERQQLVRHLKILQIANDPAKTAELSRGIQEIQDGGGVTREELLAYLHTRGITPG